MGLHQPLPWFTLVDLTSHSCFGGLGQKYKCAIFNVGLKDGFLRFPFHGIKMG
jgi:hypothetical protein